MPPWEWLGDERVAVKVDDRDQYQPGYKFNEWEARGVPVRIEIGPRDLAESKCVLARRDRPGREGKEAVGLDAAPERLRALLQEIQTALFERARALRDANTHEVDAWADFKQRIEDPGGFVWAHWDGTRETEDRIAAETKATIRCVPSNRPKEPGKCMVTGQPSPGRVVLAKAY